jgi:hypothetical protein
MASSFSDLGIELMATGENAGTWGTKTNTNLQIVEKAIGGYVEKAVTSGGTTALTITDGDATESTSVARHAVIKLTGTITGNSIVTVPDSIEKVYIVTNGTSGAYTVQFKTASGTGITFGVSEKTTRLVYSDGTNIVDAGFSGASDMEGRELILDADGDTSITADTDDQIDIKVAGSDQIKITDGAIIPSTDNDIDLGTSSLEFKDAFFDGTVTADAFAGPLTGDVTGNVSGTAATVTTAAQSNITSLGTLTTLTVDDITINGSTISDSGDFTVDGGADIILDADGGDIFFKDGGTTFGSATNTSGNLIIKSGTTTALTFSGANVTVAGDLTVSGDDITMGTNTAGNILVADGTNFNSIAAGSLSEISTIANDDVFLAVDTSGGGLKKVARSTVVSGLATSGAISNVVEDTSPQLGANLDTNSHNILIDDAHFIADENGNEQIIFQTTSSAVNQFDVTNAATGNPPKLSATGGDSNIDFDIEAKGTGHVTIRGNTNAGAIQFNCESNSHGQILKSQPHSAAVTNEMLLPAGSSSTLVSLVSTDTLTNKTLTTPVIAEIDSGSTITLDATTDIILDADGGDIIFKDGGTSIATFTNSSTDFIIESATSDKDIIFKVNDGGSSTEVARFDGDVSAFKIASGKKIMLGAAEESISGDGTDITFAVGSSGDINIPANIGLTFGDDGEKIEGDGTDLTISGNNINLTAAADVNIPSGIGLTFATAEKIESDGTDLSITVGSNGDINIPANIGLTFGDDGEKIEGDGTDLTIAGNNINLTATADVVIPANVGITFGTGEKIEGDSTDLTITSGAKINLTATSDIHVPNNVGIVFGGDSEKIEGDGTDMTISANNLTIDAAADINLDADGADVNIKDGGTTILSFTNSSSDAVITAGVQDKDIIFKGDDGGSAVTSLTLDMSAGGIATFSAAANVAQGALTSSSNAVAWDASAKPNAVHVTTENTTFSAPSNAVEGAFIVLEINYNGSHTIAFNTVFEFAASTAPTTTDTDGKTDILVFRYNGAVWQEVGRTLNLSES